jgi:hypothetical protein
MGFKHPMGIRRIVLELTADGLFGIVQDPAGGKDLHGTFIQTETVQWKLPGAFL